ncbi:phosphoadenylyl-sulfate reductase [Qipengyuania psychrotolerans]|uniref:Adenosine 5'-phosphosulfate reductase n=1 Tax=Qipengyuania psychrotolerans TaxID=2867238 RepID=A0ABX8ZF58_9SPHN|nr:phosphoadenylyl-sulfate reductase [Qipengyuania psychrotolerans]QZD87645.1 phosphoadenylyl-sulfate reductase [Qipengyuania psychrotolerans]
MNETRAIDRLDTQPRFTDQEAIRLNRMFRGAETEEWLRAVFEGDLVGDIALVSSFGAESAALLHLVSRIDASIPVLFLDTGKHFPETLAYRDELTDRFGLNRVDLYPDLADLEARDNTGLRWSYDPDGCCELRKVKPLEIALARFDASLTGRKAFQSSTRANLPRFEVDTADAQGRLKINPLIDWDAQRIAAYFEEHDLPRHPLIERGFASIGCSPCTRAIKPGEDPRSGRWAGWDKVECGIHKPGEEPFL